MKKFTLLMVAALIAVMSWAGVPVREQKQVPLQTTTMLTKAQARQVTPSKMAVKVKAPKANIFAKKAKKSAKKAVKKAGLADLLAMPLMLCSEYYEYDSEAGGLVGAAPAAGGTPITISTTAPKKENKIEWVAADQDYESPQDVTDIDISETVAGVFAAGDNTSNSPKYYSSGSAVRMYTGNTLTITSKEPMTKIEITMASNATAANTWLTSDLKEYTYSSADKVGTWTGEATNEIVFTVPTKDEAGTSSNPQARVAKITIYFAEEESEEETSPETPTIYIYGFTSSATEAIEATINTTVDEKLQAEGVIAEISIADGQTLFESSYGPVLLSNVSGDAGDPLTGYVFSDGYVMIDGLWTDILGGDGQYAGYMWSGLYYYSMVLPVNGTMTWAKSGTANEVPVVIDQDPDEIKTVTVYNFAGEETAVDVTMKADNMFAIDSQLMFDGGTGSDGTVYGEFYTYATDGNSVSATITGTGTEDALTFDGGWTLYAPTTGYWYGLLDPATIAYTDGSQFLYPVIEDVAATPADPVIEEVGNYDAEKEYGYILFDVPTTDVDGNDLRESNLYYQLYSDIAGDIQPITFTTDLYTKLEEDMSIIPYNFTDSYDFDVYEGSKLVYLNYDFNTMYDRIGVKSIYTGGDETNESEIVWVKVKEEPVEPGEGYVFDFEDGTMQGWTTIDADGDGYTWNLGASPSINTVNESSYSVYSQSYASGALTPDNYLVSPQMKLDGSISFYACAQDGAWPAEHFAVAVSTAGNTDAADFTNVEEWIMTATRVANPSFAPAKFRSAKKTPGAWYKYTVDLSSYEGQEGYVAIRHFDCTDNFYLVVDDIELVTSKIILPDYTITPTEGVVKSLNEFEITFNNYEVSLVDAAATLKNETADETWTTTTLLLEEGKLSFSFAEEEITEPGEYTLTVTGVKDGDDNDVELSFAYTIEAKPDVVVLPEGLEPETWYFSATASKSSVRNQEVAVAIDGSDIYIQGLNVDYLPEAWVKGTIEGNTATFPTGQYFGAFEYEGDEYDMFFVGYDYDADEITDVVFDFDAEAGTLTTDTWFVISAEAGTVSYYEYYQGATITREIPETPELVVLPEGIETEAWTIDGTFADSYSADNIVRATEVAFDGNDIYVKGIPFYFEEAWMKGTIDTETGIATFPTGQFVGEDEYGWEFMVGSEDLETICDIEFAYDAEAKTLTQLTGYIVENADTPDEIAPYGYWTDMYIYAGEPIIIDPVEAPEGLETESYLFTASCLENGEEEAQDYSYQTQVGFDGQDVYFKGVSEDTSDMWLKGTLSEDGKTVTIPANQYMGQSTVLWYTFDYYFTAVAEDGETMEDIVLNYDAETSTFTTDQTLVLHDGKRELGEPYQTFTNVVITKMEEFAATPADPSIDEFKLTDTTYPKAYFVIPAEDVDGNALLTAKLFYSVWYMEEGSETPQLFTAVAGEDAYSKLPEDMTEIPYDYEDSWDIYKGGSTFYFNPVEVVTNWTKFGVQSIYYGGGERNVSNIVWSDGDVTEPVYTGITDVNFNNQKVVIFDLQGRRVAQPAKGLYIVNGKKTVMK